LDVLTCVNLNFGENMKNTMVSVALVSSLLFVGCVENEDGSSKLTYSSCKITSSSALFSKDRVKDLEQCWNFPGDGYESKSDALV
jgi:hypothetical protein